MSPSTATRRRAGSAASVSSAACIDVGLALYESFSTSAPPRERRSSIRQGDTFARPIAAAAASSGTSHTRATASAAAAFVAMWAPGTASDSSALPHGVTAVKRARAPSDRWRPLTATSAPGEAAEGDHPGARRRGHRGHPLVVGVEDGHARGRQGLHQLGLGPSHAVDAPQQLGVGGRHHRDHADGGPADLAQPGDLAGAPRTHLEHQGLGVVGGVEDGDRQAPARCCTSARWPRCASGRAARPRPGPSPTSCPPIR